MCRLAERSEPLLQFILKSGEIIENRKFDSKKSDFAETDSAQTNSAAILRDNCFQYLLLLCAEARMALDYSFDRDSGDVVSIV